MDTLIRFAVIVQVFMAILTAWFLLDSDALERLGVASDGGERLAAPEEEPMPVGGKAVDAKVAQSGVGTAKRAMRIDPDAALVEWLIASAVARSGVDEAEVERRVAEIEATKKRTVEVKRAEEERRISEVADWFDHLMAHHPESGATARDILDEYIEFRYRTYGDMEDVDPEFARGQRESIRQHVGQRLMSELPPAQGATVLKQLFI